MYEVKYGTPGYEKPKAWREAEEHEETGKPDEDDGLNDCQRRILKEIDGGAELRQKDVIAMFWRNWNPSTVKHDIKGLREMGLIETHPDGYYVRPTGSD